MHNTPFKISSSYVPAGDQPQAIDQLVNGIIQGERDQVLLGVTGSGKTFTIANVIEKVQKPALVMAPNKILAAQLYSEMKEFFPNNAVEYFVSYYDYYQPEAYVPKTDTFIEKESAINEQIDRMRHSATRALIERRDVIIVASVSCIYGIGGANTYSQMRINVKKGENLNRDDFIKQLISLQYKRNDLSLVRGNFRARGDVLELFPAHYADRAWRISFWGDEAESVWEIDALTGEKYCELDEITIFANSHYVTPGPTIQQAIKEIKKDLATRLKEFEADNKLLEAQRLEQRTKFDLEMLASTGMCAGIENYSRYLTGRAPGEPPPTLLEYLPPDSLIIVDESHVTVSQTGAMYKGDRSRKITLSDHGFRLPSCADNRPLKFEEWNNLRPQTIYVSATPGPWELEQSHGVFVEQIIRPTGLVDPECIVKPCTDQVDDLLDECRKTIKKGYRILVTTLTKKMAETLTDYMVDSGLKVKYLHSDIDTLERIEIIRDLRLGVFDVLVGINLLREGLDIPECGLVAILDADKEGFLRSKTSLVQTIGRAARNADGRVILYADHMTQSLEYALSETDRRRNKQNEYNIKHNITPKSTARAIELSLIDEESKMIEKAQSNFDGLDIHNSAQILKKRKELEKKMIMAAEDLNFEEAAKIRDQIKLLESVELGMPINGLKQFKVGEQKNRKHKK